MSAASRSQCRIKHGSEYFDLWHGVELKPEIAGDKATLSFTIEALGFGAVLAVEHRLTAGICDDFLSEMQQPERCTARQLFKRVDMFCRNSLLRFTATKAAAAAPEGMVQIPRGTFNFRVCGHRDRRRRSEIGVDVQYPWEDSPRRDHIHTMEIAPFYIDRYPVTNEQFKKFLDATHYHPEDDHNFLRDWKNGTYPDGLGEQAGDVGVVGRCACVCGLGGQATSA